MTLNTLDPRKPGGVRWIHVNLTLVLIVLLASTWAAVGGYFVAKHQQESGGYKPQPIPLSRMAPVATQPLGGVTLPASWSLASHIARIHDQGNSNSCVSQTLSEMAEIYSRERHIILSFSGGYFWSLLNGGSDVGITYQGAFPIFENTGAVTLAHYPYDGQYVTGYAGYRSTPYRVSSWFGVWNYDRITIESELRAGNPLAFAIPVYTSFYNSWGNGSLITGQSGSFLFYHSMVIIGYDQDGLLVQGSWGRSWGAQGLVRLSWGFLSQYAIAVVAAPPVSTWPAYHPPKPKPTFPLKRWHATTVSYNHAHPKHPHKSVSPYNGKAISRIAQDWWKSGLSKKFAGPGAVAHWDARNKVMRESFPGRVIVYEWSRVRGAPLKWVRAGKTIRVNR